jgi:hypothetical protein
MNISLYQKGGIFGITRHLDVADGELEITERDVLVHQRMLTQDERAPVEDLAQQLLAASHSQEAIGSEDVSDSMFTEVRISEGEEPERIYSALSGDEGTDELWALIAALDMLTEPPTEASAAESSG